jgi:hypothetical protein
LRTVVAAGLTFAVIGAGLLSAPAGADPIQDADATVQSLRQEADAAAQEYFDALSRATALDAKIAGLEAKLPDLAARRRKLRHHAERRAVAAYVRSGAQLAALFDSADALTVARRRQLLAQLNGRDDEAFVALVKVSQRFERQRNALRDARAAQQSALDELTQRGRDIDTKLQAAVDRRNHLQAEAAAAEAARAAAAAAAAATPADPVPGAAVDVPTTAPPGYKPTPGTHAHHDDPFLACTRGMESGGNYSAVNPAGPYLGAYQLLQSTWNSGANHVGRVDLIGVPPNKASEYDQDDVAWGVYEWQGKGPWSDRC